MQKEKSDAAKKEGGNLSQDIEKKYGLNKYRRDEFLKLMEKEFIKLDKKLTRIANYEKMKSEGKTLNEEMEELISRKNQLLQTVKVHKKTLDIYQKSTEISDENPKLTNTNVAKEEPKAKAVTTSELKKLSYFFAVAEVLKRKVSSNPLANLTGSKKEELTQMVDKIMNPKEETCLAVMAAEISGVLSSLLRNNEAANTLNQIMGSNEITGMRFRFIKGETKSFSGSQPPPEIFKRSTKEEVAEPIHEKSAIPKEPSKEEMSVKTEEHKKESAWADMVSDDDDKSGEDGEEEKEEENDGGDGFEIVLSRSEARKMRMEQNLLQRGRGRGNRGRGRGRGRSNYGGAEEGEFRGGRGGRGRGDRRGRGRRYGERGNRGSDY